MGGQRKGDQREIETEEISLLILLGKVGCGPFDAF